MALGRPTYRRPLTRQKRSPVTAIAGTTVIAVLAVVVAVLSYHAATKDSSGSAADVSRLEARLDELAGQLAATQATAQAAARQARASLAAAKKKPTRATAPVLPGLATCLSEVQREIDDLQAFLAYRTPPHRNRVHGSCATLLKPRFNR
jgi:hypothetical protein